MVAAMDLAKALAGKAPLALALAKRAVNEGIYMPLHEALKHEAELFGQISASRDHAEGTAAFLEKRKPEWSGR
jgi:enoyl-CoA hydratase/carnithine racemase